jgi:hypothetical protein
MVNYSNSKVYKIEPRVEHESNEIYIGSTTKVYLSQRMDTHRSNYKLYKACKYHFVTVFKLFDKYGVENCDILLLENVNAANKDELRTREAYYIRGMKCVNKRIEDRTQKEYYVDNKDKIKQYYEDNKDKIKQYYKDNKDIKKQSYEDNKEKIKAYRDTNKEKMKVYQKHYREKVKQHKKKTKTTQELEELEKELEAILNK